MYFSLLRLTKGLVVSFSAAAILWIGIAKAEETPPIWTSNFGSSPINIEQGSVLDITISASGGANTKIECTDCNSIKVTDNGNGTARIFWDTQNPSLVAIGPYLINLKAINKADATKVTLGLLNFNIIQPSTAPIKWTSGLSSVSANYGGVFDVNISASGGSDTKISCTNCDKVSLTDKGNGTARLYWDTSKNVGLVPGPYTVNLVAESKSNPASKIVGSLDLVLLDPSPVTGAPQWTSKVNKVYVKAGEVSAVKISATGGAETGFDCPSCIEATLKDNGDGTADLVWDTKKNLSFPYGQYLVNVRAFNKKDPAKVSLGEITYVYIPTNGGTDQPETGGTSTPVDAITSEYLVGRYKVPEGYKGPIPDCAFSGTCRSTSDLVILLINIAKFLFSLIGVVAFAAFIYGGFMMIFSFGNSEKVGQGKDAMVAAVVGLVIAFGAYLIINFILNALGVASDFKGIIN